MRAAWGGLVTLVALAGGCASSVGPGGDAGADVDGSVGDAAADAGSPTTGPNVRLDLLLDIQNANSMRDNQALFLAQVPALVDALAHPACVSASNPTPHACNPADTSDTPQAPAVTDMHVGVIDGDLGTPGAQVPGCDDTNFGDDGRLNPIRNGAAEAHHEPWAANLLGYPRPADCTDPNEFPSFIAFDSSMLATAGYETGFDHDVACNAALYINGCGLQAPLEAMWRALLWHDPSSTPGNTDVNAGFLREQAVLAIVLVSDREDESVQNCMYARGTTCNANALDVYQASSTSWANMNLRMRFYMYQPGGPQDPTWPPSRYIDPRDPSQGLLALKPGHPERVVFAAITGVPLESEFAWRGPDGTIQWDMLLGTPDPTDANNYDGRNAGPGSTAINALSPEGLVSMYQANLDTGPSASPDNCPLRTVPSCRRAGTMPNPMSSTYCTPDDQYFAWPARRIVEVARRFDQATVCNGSTCHNGTVSSICNTDYTTQVGGLVHLIQRRLFEAP